MRPTLLAVLAICTLTYGTLTAQESPVPKVPPAKIDYSILGQPAHAARVNLTDEQRAKIAEILDTRVNDLVEADPENREKIVTESNAQIEMLLSDEQKTALAASLTDGKLQFSFHKQKWSAVLVWFAQQAGLSLVMDKEPPGLFTYNDTREFTPSEAIDLLNSVLLSKNFTLIRRERMLIVVDTSTGVPYDLVQQVPLEKLSEFGRFEIVTTEFPLAGRPLDAVVEAVTPLVGTHGQVIPLAAAGKILVTETAGRLKAINVVISSIPIPEKPAPPKAPEKPPEPVLITYPAPGLEPETTTDVLRLLFPAATIKFDPNAEVIHCLAPPLVQAGVQASLAKLIESVTGDNLARLQTYAVPAKQLVALVDQVSLAHPDLAIASDPERNRLLVVASAQEHAEVQKTLKSLGATSNEPTDVETAKLVLYPVDAASIEVVTSILSDIIPGALIVSDVGRIAVRGTEAEQDLARSTIAPFADPATDRPTLSFYPLENPLSTEMLAVLTAAIPEATVTWLAEDKQLSVLGTLKDHDRVVQTLAQIKEAGAVSKQKSLAYYPVSPHQKSRLQMIQADLPGELASMLLMTDSMPGEVIGWGTQQQHEELQRLLVNLKKNEPSLVTQPTKLELTVAAPAELLAMLQTRFPGTEMVLNEHSNLLYVWADGETLDSIRVAFDAITATLPPREDPVMIPYSLHHADATAVLALLMGMRPELNAAADTHSNRILVSAPLNLQTRYKVLIEQLDSQPSEPNESKVESYALKSIAPTTALTVLTPLFPELTLTSDSVNNRLVASGAAFHHQRLIAAIERIDAPAADKDTRLESYDLGDANPTQIVSVLAQLAPTAIASLSADANKVFVWGDEGVHRIVKQAMEQLTISDPKHSRSMKAYPLPKGAGATALTIMQPVAKEAALSLDATYDNLIAWATEEEHLLLATAIEGLSKDLVKSDDKTTEVYRFQKGTPTAAYTVLSTLTPKATLAIDLPTSVLVATGTAQEHALIKSVIDQIESDPQITRSMKAYPLPRGASTTAVAIMQPVAADASFSLDETKENLIVWATESEHKSVGEAVESLRKDLVNPDGDDQTVAVYPLDPELISAASLVETLDDAIVDRLSVQPNVETNSLIVSGSKEAQAKFAETIETITSQLKKTNELQTHVYRFIKAAPTVALDVLESLLPDATFAIDEETSVLVATATARQHESIAAVVRQIDTEEATGTLTTQVYRLHRASARTVHGAFEMMAPKAQIGYDTGSNVIIATASPEDHKILKDAAAQVEGRASGGSVKVYRLSKVNASLAASAVQSIIDGQSIEADVQANEEQNSLVVVAEAAEQKVIEDAIRQLDSDDRTIEVFKLLVNDPFNVERSVKDMFNNLPEAARPQLTVDFENGKLFVNGSKDQVEQVRELLVKMGEPLPEQQDDNRPGTGTTRTIRFSGNTVEAVQQIQAIWPKLRKNRIQVITPSDRGIQPIVPSGDPLEIEPKPIVPAQNLQSNNGEPFDQIAQLAIQKTVTSTNGTTLVVFQNTTRAAEPSEDDEKEQAVDAELPPVMIVADGDSIMISSEDTEALDRMESLLKAMAGSGIRGPNNANFAVFLLRNSGASDAQKLLKDLFDALPFNQGGGIRETVVVADDRLNALVVHGNRQSREMVGQLLEVLDSQGLPDPLNVYKSEIFDFKHIHVSRALAILQNVYKPQLLPGMGKKPIEIPEGVTTTVASVLNQINASNRGPILTLEMDETTNSLIMRAPSELRDEIREFAEKLDEKGAGSNNRSVRVIQLKQGKSDIIQGALEQFIGDQPSSSRSKSR